MVVHDSFPGSTFKTVMHAVYFKLGTPKASPATPLLGSMHNIKWPLALFDLPLHPILFETLGPYLSPEDATFQSGSAGDDVGLFWCVAFVLILTSGLNRCMYHIACKARER